MGAKHDEAREEAREAAVDGVCSRGLVGAALEVGQSEEVEEAVDGAEGTAAVADLDDGADGPDGREFEGRGNERGDEVGAAGSVGVIVAED